MQTTQHQESAMKRQKRDRTERAYARGYHAGLNGKSRDFCPFDNLVPKSSWLNGWREGRADQHYGMTGIASVQNLKNLG
jgi:ribosome modulation factor